MSMEAAGATFTIVRKICMDLLASLSDPNFSGSFIGIINSFKTTGEQQQEGGYVGKQVLQASIQTADAKLDTMAAVSTSPYINPEQSYVIVDANNITLSATPAVAIPSNGGSIRGDMKLVSVQVCAPPGTVVTVRIGGVNHVIGTIQSTLLPENQEPYGYTNGNAPQYYTMRIDQGLPVTADGQNAEIMVYNTDGNWLNHQAQVLCTWQHSESTGGVV